MPVSIHIDRRFAPPSRLSLRLTQGAARTRGFTLIELMITVAVIAILAAIALPSYYKYILRSNRSAAESFMQEVASAQERYMVDSRQFGSLADLGYSNVPDTVSSHYTVAMVVTPASTTASPNYTITATPTGSQADDTDCATLTLNGDGSKAASGSATNCWK